MESIVPSERLRRELKACYWRILDGACSASEACTVAHDLRRLEALAPRMPGWDDRHAYFEQTARPVTERMLERLAPARAHTILELAAGTGIAGFAASALVGPGGRVIAVTSRGRRRTRPEALRAPLQRRPPPRGDRPGIARFHDASRFRCTEDVRSPAALLTVQATENPA
jgi:hypothetical protein